jgi:hypothetical protein
MARPTSATTVGRPDLGAIAYEYLIGAADRGFVCLDLLPVFDVQEQAGNYPVIPIEALLKLQTTARASRGAYSRGDWEFELGNYSCKENGWEEPVDDSESKLYQRYFDAEQIATLRAVDILLRAQEARVAAKIFNTANITATADVAIPWGTAATAVPRANIMTAKLAMRAASGLDPNVAVMSRKVFDTLMMTKEITDAFMYTNPIQVGGYDAQKLLMAQYFGVDKILVAGAIKDGAKKGQAYSISDLWDDEYVGLFKVSSGGSDLREPCLGRTFLWTGDSPQNVVTESYREEQTRSNVYRVRQNTDEAFVFTGAGYLLGNIIHP